jgi:hypothetical protein
MEAASLFCPFKNIILEFYLENSGNKVHENSKNYQLTAIMELQVLRKGQDNDRNFKCKP